MSGTVVIGVTGGCGTTTFACGLALAGARDGESVLLVDLDPNGGGPSTLWGIPATRALDDLRPLGEGLTSRHLDHLIHRHPAGIDVVAGARAPESVVDWMPAAVAALVAHVTARPAWVVDAGRGDTSLARALVARAHTVVVLVPRTVHGAHRLSRAGWIGEAPRLAAVATELPAGERVPARALARVLGHEVVATAPRDDRAAAQVAVAQWPRGRGLARAVADVRDLA